MKHFTLKRLTAVAASACLVASLAACSGGGETSSAASGSSSAASSAASSSAASSASSQAADTGKEATVSFALWDEVQSPVFEEICKKFTEENPNIKVDLQLTPWSQYWTKLDAAAGAGNAADVFWMNVNLPKYADAGILEPVETYFTRDGLDKAKWSPAMVELYTYQDQLYTMPKGMDVVVVAYNKAIFDKYGVEYPKEGWTWADMEKIGADLRDKIAAAGGSEYPMLMELDAQPSFLQFILQDGVEYYSADGKTSGFAEQGTIDAFTDLVKLMDEKIMPDFKVLSDTKGTDLFISEKGAMLYVGSWKSSVLDGASFAKNIGMVTMPKRTSSNVCALGGISYALNANRKTTEEAWQLVKYLGGYDSNKMQAEARIEIPAYLEAQEFYAPSFQGIDPTAFIEQSKNSCKYPTHPGMTQWSSDITDYTTKIFSKELTPEEGCKQLAEVVQKKMDEYNAANS